MNAKELVDLLSEYNVLSNEHVMQEYTNLNKSNKEWLRNTVLNGKDTITLDINVKPDIYGAERSIYNHNYSLYVALRKSLATELEINLYDAAELLMPVYKRVANTDFKFNKDLNHQEFSIKEGAKYPRGVRRAIAKKVSENTLKMFDDWVQLYSKIQQVKAEVKQLHISSKVEDFLTMSCGNSWSSCHHIEDGSWRIGAYALAIDNTSLIAWIGEDTNEKEFRTLIHINEKAFGISKHYPYQIESVNDEVVKLLKNKDTFKDFNENDGVSKSVTYGYNDGLQCKHSLVDEFTYIKTAHSALCINCGDFIDDNDDANPNCCLKWCGHCESYHESEMYEVRGTYGWEWVCEDCKDEYFTYCDKCNDYHLDDEVISTNEGNYCNGCFSELYAQCECCYDDCLLDDMQYNENDELLCSDCYEQQEDEKENYHNHMEAYDNMVEEV